jgi:allophanate hydrolase subunit 1
MVKGAKSSNSIGGGIFKKDKDGKFTTPTSWDAEYERAVSRLKSNYSKEEFEKIMDVIQSQRDDVLKTFDTEGGDMDQIIEKVRTKTEHLKALVQDQYRKLKRQGAQTPVSSNGEN